ncbi:hypothetical protein UQ24_00670 [Escherichia coli]|nr:hypothetical protein UQ24_00670 [Escherichia coli]
MPFFTMFFFMCTPRSGTYPFPFFGGVRWGEETGPVTAVGAGEDERQRAGQGDVGFTGKDLCTEQGIDRMAGRHSAGAHRTGHAGGGTNAHPG